MQQRQFPFDPLKRNFKKKSPTRQRKMANIIVNAIFFFCPNVYHDDIPVLCMSKNNVSSQWTGMKQIFISVFLQKHQSLADVAFLVPTRFYLFIHRIQRKTQWIFDEKSYFSFFRFPSIWFCCLYPSTGAVPSLLAFHSVNILSFLVLMFYIMIICQNCYCLWQEFLASIFYCWSFFFKYGCHIWL